MDEGTMVVNIYELHTNCEARAQTVAMALRPFRSSWISGGGQDTTHSPNLGFAERVAWTLRETEGATNTPNIWNTPTPESHRSQQAIPKGKIHQNRTSFAIKNIHCIGLLGKFYRKPPYFMVKTMGFRLRCSFQSNESHPRSRDSVPHSPRVLEAHPSHRRERANTPGSSHHGISWGHITGI